MKRSSPKRRPINHPAAVTARREPFGQCAAAGIPQVGLRPSFVTPAVAHCHPDCRWLVILIVALQHQSDPSFDDKESLL